MKLKLVYFLLSFYVGFNQNFPDSLFVNKMLNAAFSNEYNLTLSYVQEFKENNDSLSYYFYSAFFAHLWNKDFENFNITPFGNFNELNEKVLKMTENKETDWQEYIYWQCTMFKASATEREGSKLSAYFLAKEASYGLIKLSQKNKVLADAQLTSAIYLYWKSVSTLSIPFFTDDRKEAFQYLHDGKKGRFYNELSTGQQYLYILDHQKKFDEAIVLLEELKLKHNSRFIKWAEAKILLHLKRYNESLNIYEELFNFYISVKSEYNIIECLLKIISIYKELNENEKALEFIAKNQNLLSNLNKKDSRLNAKFEKLTDLTSELRIK